HLVGCPTRLLSFPTRRSSDLLREDLVLRRADLDFLSAAVWDRERRLEQHEALGRLLQIDAPAAHLPRQDEMIVRGRIAAQRELQDRKSTRLNSSHVSTSYAVF